MSSWKTTVGLAAMVAVSVVVLNGLGLRAMGLRHSGAHILVEFGSAFLVAIVVRVGVAVRDFHARRTGAASAERFGWAAPRGQVAPVADRIANARGDVDPDASTTAWTPKSHGARA